MPNESDVVLFSTIVGSRLHTNVDADTEGELTAVGESEKRYDVAVGEVPDAVKTVCLSDIEGELTAVGESDKR